MKSFKMSLSSGMVSAAALMAAVPAAFAQEACYREARERVVEQAHANNDELERLLILYDENPDQFVQYRGIEFSVKAALINEWKAFDKTMEAVSHREINRAEHCASRPEVAHPRAAWDYFRTTTGLTNLFPEAATRVDFSELEGGENAFLNKALRDIGEFGEHIGEDLGRMMRDLNETQKEFFSVGKWKI